MVTLKVAKTSSISAVAGAIAKFIREDRQVHIQSIGNETLCRVIKSIMLATQYMAQEGAVIASIIESFQLPEGVACMRFTVLVVGQVIPTVTVSESDINHPPSMDNPRAN